MINLVDYMRMQMQLNELNFGIPVLDMLGQPMDHVQRFVRLRQDPNNNGELNDNYMCHLCFKKGHLIRFCPKVRFY